MTDLPYLASRLYGTPLLIARPKLEAILGVIARKRAGEPLAMPADAPPPTGLQKADGIAVLPILGTLVRRASYLGAASGLVSYHAIEAMAEEAFADDEVKAVAQADLNYTFLHAGARKIDGHPHAPLPDGVAVDIKADLDRLHDQFIALIAGFRRLTPEAVRATEAGT